jgi:hypothetical protein
MQAVQAGQTQVFKKKKKKKIKRHQSIAVYFNLMYNLFLILLR